MIEETFNEENLLKNERIREYERNEDIMNQELNQKKKEKIKLEKIKKMQREKEREEHIKKLRNNEKQMKYLITANELKWGDYKELDYYQNMDERLQNYKIACKDILEKKQIVVETLNKKLCLFEKEFEESLESYQQGNINKM